MITFGITILCLVISAESFDYCKINKNHIGCNNNGEISSICRNNAKMVDLDKSGIKKLLIKKHNEKRNLISLGKLNRYDSAVRMVTMQWDDELAMLAGLNVKTCKFEHDANRNTEKYKYSGQNLGYQGSYPDMTAKVAAEKIVEMWFSEHPNADMSVIDKYRQTKKPNGHFTVMVADKNVRLGCAIIQVLENKMTTYTMACNYATTNIIDKPIYVKGKTASKCLTGTNKNYPGLCSIAEEDKVDPNKIF